MVAPAWPGVNSEGRCPRGSVWVEGPAVTGLYGLLPTEVVAQRLQEGACSARVRTGQEGAEGAMAETGEGAVGTSGVDGVSGGAHTVEEEASVLRELVFYYLRAGGGLVGECISAGAPLPTPAVLLARDLSSWMPATEAEGHEGLDLGVPDTSTSRARAPRPHVLVQERQPEQMLVLSPWRLRRYLAHSHSGASRDGADDAAMRPVVTWCVPCACLWASMRGGMRACVHAHGGRMLASKSMCAYAFGGGVMLSACLRAAHARVCA